MTSPLTMSQSQRFVRQELRTSSSKDDFNIRHLSPGSTKEIEILEIFYKTFLDIKNQRPIHDIDIAVIENAQLERHFKEKRNEMKSKGCTNEELQEHFAFDLAQPQVAKQIARYGLFCKVKSWNAIGDSAYGVNLVMHADVALEFKASNGYRPPFTLIIYKIYHGRVKAVQEESVYEAKPAQPTPEYTSHMEKKKPTSSMPLPRRVDRSNIYIFDFDKFNNLTMRPRQVLPFAIITIKTNLLEFFRPKELSPIQKTLEPGRKRSPIPRKRSRSPIIRPMKYQKGCSPIPRSVESGKDRRIIDVSRRQNDHVPRDSDRHQSRSRSSSSKKHDDRSRKTQERSLSSRRRGLSPSKSKGNSSNRHKIGRSKGSVQEIVGYEEGECTDTTGTSGHDDNFERIMTESGQITVRVNQGDDTSGVGGGSRSSTTRQRHRSKGPVHQHTHVTKRGASRYCEKSLDRKHRDRSRTRSVDTRATPRVLEDYDENNNQLGFEEEEILNREICDLMMDKNSWSQPSTPKSDFDSECSSSRNSSTRKSLSGAAGDGNMCDLRDMLRPPVSDLREKLSRCGNPLPDLRERLSGIPDLREKLSAVPLPDLRETLSNPLPDLRESLSRPIKRNHQSLAKVSVEMKDPRKPVMYEDIQTFTTVEVMKEPLLLTRNREEKIDSPMSSQVTSNYDSEPVLSDLPEISDVELCFEGEGFITVDTDGDASDKLVINESPFSSSTERTPCCTTDTETNFLLPLVYSIKESPFSSSSERTPHCTTDKETNSLLPLVYSEHVSTPKKTVTDHFLSPVAVVKKDVVVGSSPAPPKVDNNFSTPSKILVANCMSPQSPSYPDFQEFRSLSARFGALNEKDSVKEHGIPHGGVLESPSVMSVSGCNSSFNILENLQKIRVSVEESSSRGSCSPLGIGVGIDRVDGSVQIHPKELSSDTMKQRKRKLNDEIGMHYNSNEIVHQGVDSPKIRKLDREMLNVTALNSDTKAKENLDYSGDEENVDYNSNDVLFESLEGDKSDAAVMMNFFGHNSSCSTPSPKTIIAPADVTTEFIIKALLEQQKLAETDQDKEAVECAVSILMQNVNVVERVIKAELSSKFGDSLTSEENRTNFEACPENIIEDERRSLVGSPQFEAIDSDDDFSKFGEEFDVDLDDFDVSYDTVCQDEVTPSPDGIHCSQGEIRKTGAHSPNISNVYGKWRGLDENSCDSLVTQGTSNTCESAELKEGLGPDENFNELYTDVLDDVGEDDSGKEEEESNHSKKKDDSFISPNTNDFKNAFVYVSDTEQDKFNKTNLNPQDMDMESSSDDDTGVELPPPVCYSTYTASRDVPPKYVEHDEFYSPMQRLEDIYSSNNCKASGWGSNNERRPTGRGQTPTGRGQTPTGRGQAPTGRGQAPTGRGQAPFPNPSRYVNYKEPARIVFREKSAPETKHGFTQPAIKRENTASVTSTGMRYEDAMIETKPGAKRPTRRNDPMPYNQGDMFGHSASLSTGSFLSSTLSLNKNAPSADFNPAQPSSSFPGTTFQDYEQFGQTISQFINQKNEPSGSSSTGMIHPNNMNTQNKQGGYFRQSIPPVQSYYYSELGSQIPTAHKTNNLTKGTLYESNKINTAQAASVEENLMEEDQFSPNPPSPPSPEQERTSEEGIINEEASYEIRINTHESFLDVPPPPKKKKGWPTLKKVTVDLSYPSVTASARPAVYDYRGGKMVIRYAEEASATIKTHPGLSVPTQNWVTGQSLQDTKKYFGERRQNRAIGVMSSLFHGRTLLKGQVKPRKIPAEPLYLKHPDKKSGKLELIPTDPRPAYYSVLKEERAKEEKAKETQQEKQSLA